jgi:hypothetical protein
MSRVVPSRIEPPSSSLIVITMGTRKFLPTMPRWDSGAPAKVMIPPMFLYSSGARNVVVPPGVTIIVSLSLLGSARSAMTPLGAELK